VAYENIRAFHAAQQPEDLDLETMPGVRCRRISRPIGAVGLYVPGGTAVLPSSALMLAVPARLAGCGTIVLATPPRPDGTITPEVVYCARKAGVTHLLKAGGAQAVAAMAWGTQSCPKVRPRWGPGRAAQGRGGRNVAVCLLRGRPALACPASLCPACPAALALSPSCRWTRSWVRATSL
jgi:histidinol dehydrogenase